MKIGGEAGIATGRMAPFFGSATTLAVISRERGTDRVSQGGCHQRLVYSPTLQDGNCLQDLHLQ